MMQSIVDATSPEPVRQRAWGALATNLVFAGVLWFIATFAFLGRLGQWRDDFDYCKRDLATGENLLTFGVPTVPHFYRPLYYMTQPWLQSELAGHWTNHLISALVQAVIALLAYRLMRRLGVWRAAACACAVTLFVMPQTWEITFYLAAMPTGMSCLTFLLLALVCLRWYRWPGAGGWRAWVMPLVIFALSLAVPCWNEQMGAAAPAVFLLALGERRADGKRPLGRAFVATAAACAAQALYLALYWATRPATGRGGAETLVGMEELPQRFEAFWRAMRFIAFMEHRFAEEAMRTGFQAMAAHPGFAVLGIAAVVISGSAWLARTTRESNHDSPDARASRTLAAVGFGLATFVLAWLPLFILRGQGVESRTWFPPAIGLVVAVAGLIQALVRTRVGSRPTVRFALAAVFIVLAAPSLVALVGIQSALQQRTKLDERQAMQIKALAPNPRPWTVFVPLEVMRPAGQRWSRFRETFVGPWEHLPAATPSIKWTYRRGDVVMGWRKRWSKLAPILSATEAGLVYDDRSALEPTRLYKKLPGAERAPTVLSWDRVIPFVLDPDGNVVLADRVSDIGPDGELREFEATAVKRLIDASRNPKLRVARVRLDVGREKGVNPVQIVPARPETGAGRGG